MENSLYALFIHVPTYNLDSKNIQERSSLFKFKNYFNRMFWHRSSGTKQMLLFVSLKIQLFLHPVDRDVDRWRWLMMIFSDALIEMVGDSDAALNPGVPPDKYYNPGSHIALKCIIRNTDHISQNSVAWSNTYIFIKLLAAQHWILIKFISGFSPMAIIRV